MKETEQEKYGAMEKCRAVLAVWMERKKASELCREMRVSGSLFSQWQDRAVSGMLEALEPRGTREGVEGPALPMQIKRLLDRKIRARELQGMGRQASSFRRTARSRSSVETPSPVVAS